MAYINTGIARSLTVTVNKTVGGIQAMGYPKTYDGKLEFPGYAAITDEQAQRLTDEQFTARLNAFKAYVEGREPGSDFDTQVIGDGAIINDASCLPTTTTTTAPEEEEVRIADIAFTDNSYLTQECDAFALPRYVLGKSARDLLFSLTYGFAYGTDIEYLEIVSISGSDTVVQSGIGLPSPPAGGLPLAAGDKLYATGGVFDYGNLLLKQLAEPVSARVTTVQVRVKMRSYSQVSNIANITYTVAACMAPVTTTTTEVTESTLDVILQYIGGSDTNDGLSGTFYVDSFGVTIPNFSKSYPNFGALPYRLPNGVHSIDVSDIRYYAEGYLHISVAYYRVNGGTWEHVPFNGKFDVTLSGTYVNLQIKWETEGAL